MGSLLMNSIWSPTGAEMNISDSTVKLDTSDSWYNCFIGVFRYLIAETFTNIQNIHPRGLISFTPQMGSYDYVFIQPWLFRLSKYNGSAVKQSGILRSSDNQKSFFWVLFRKSVF